MNFYGAEACGGIGSCPNRHVQRVTKLLHGYVFSDELENIYGRGNNDKFRGYVSGVRWLVGRYRARMARLKN